MDKACTIRYDGSPIYADTALYSGWTINKHAVTFNSNGGTAVTTLTVDWNTTITPLTPTREGYSFLGWFIDSTCSTLYNGSPIRANTTLYAGWKINTYTVTFNSDGGTAVTTLTVDWNTTITPIVPTKEGYSFLGWFIDSTTKYTGQTIKSNMALTAHWQIIIYTVTFMVDDETYMTMEVSHGTSLVEAVAQAKLQNKNVLAVSVPSGMKQDANATDFQIVENSTIELTSMSTEQQIATNWQQYLIYALLGALLVSIVACIPLIIKKKRKYTK